MKNILYLVVGILILLAIAIVFAVTQNIGTEEETGNTESSEVEEVMDKTADEAIGENDMTNDEAVMTPAVVHYTNSGFSPSSITISAGEAVTFINESSGAFWPASAVHPVHTVYPGSSITKCGTGERATIFDACDSIDSGQEWSFVFGETGEWRYHDHLRPLRTGLVVVE